MLVHFDGRLKYSAGNIPGIYNKGWWEAVHRGGLWRGIGAGSGPRSPAPGVSAARDAYSSAGFGGSPGRNDAAHSMKMRFSQRSQMS